MVTKNHDQLNTLSCNLLSLIDNFKSLEGNCLIIATFLEKLELKRNPENELTQYIIDETLSDLISDISEYKIYLSEIHCIINKLKKSISID